MYDFCIVASICRAPSVSEETPVEKTDSQEPPPESDIQP